MEDETRGEVRVISPDEAPSFWQPVPANGFVRCILSGRELGTGFSMGTQTVAPGCMVREHTHDRHDEVIHVTEGQGFARIEGEDRPIEPGSTVFLGRNRRHGFVNPGPAPMSSSGSWPLAGSRISSPPLAALGRPVSRRRSPSRARRMSRRSSDARFSAGPIRRRASGPGARCFAGVATGARLSGGNHATGTRKERDPVRPAVLGCLSK